MLLYIACDIVYIHDMQCVKVRQHISIKQMEVYRKNIPSVSHFFPCICTYLYMLHVIHL